MTGVVASLSCLSFTTLIFSGPLQPDAGRGLTLVLLSAFLVRLLVTGGSSFSVALASPVAAPVAISALMAADLSTAVAPARLFDTLLATLALSGCLTGLLLLALGRARAGNLTSYVPYPVVGGYLAGTGWMLFVGGLKILGLAPGADLAAHAARWIPGLTGAVLMLLASRRWPRFPVLPTALGGALLAFHALLPALGIPLARAREAGWLPPELPSQSWLPSPLWLFSGQVDWAAVGDQWVGICSIPVLVAVSASLTASSLELASGRSVDLDRELRVTGLANLVLAPVGGLTGAAVPVDSLLAWSLGGRTRRTGLISALVLLAAALAGPGATGLVPRFLQGGLVAYLGLSILQDWLLRGWSRLSRADFAVVLTIVVFVAVFGFLPGVAVGLCLAILLFVRNYSRVSVVRLQSHGGLCRSNVARPRADHRRLLEAGPQVCVLRLQGYLFFGSARQVLDAVRERSREPLTHVLLDFSNVTGLDSSAALVLRKLRNRVEETGTPLIFAGLKQADERTLRQGDALGATVRLAQDLDRGLELCEEELLGSRREGDDSLLSEIFGAERERVQGYLRVVPLASGQVLFREGEPPDGLYFLETGRASVLIDECRLRTFPQDTILGEVGHYAGQPRSATVQADMDCTLHYLSAAEYNRMEREAPALAGRLARYLVVLLSERLRHREAEARARD